MNITCKLYFVELTSKMYKTLLFTFMHLIIDTYKLSLPNMNITLRKTTWYYTINSTVSQLILQTSNTGSRNWFLYLRQHIQRIIVLYSTTQDIPKIRQKKDIQFRILNQKHNFCECIYHPRYQTDIYRLHKLFHYIQVAHEMSYHWLCT